jgi:2'-5' RNA ligase
MFEKKLNEVNDEINALIEKMKEISAKIDEFTDFRNKLRDRIVFLEGKKEILLQLLQEKEEQKDTNKGEPDE